VAGIFAIRIEGPDGEIGRAQIFANVRQMRAEWLPDIWLAVGQYARQVIMARQFGAEGGHLGGGWASLSDKYRNWKERHGYSTRIGVRTGAMRQAITGKSASQGSRALKHKSGSVAYTPILNHSADGVTIGGSADEGRGDYAQHFNIKRKVFGKNNLNSRDEIELGKMLTLPFVAAAHTKEMGAPVVDDRVSAEYARFIAKARLRKFAA
tara:strand:+ start:1044 stop:1670 length:627 start_codon:yes stop_codon:yes gene_type:complete